MNLRDRVVAFEQLGSILSNIKKTKSFNDVIKNVQINNPWFVQSNVIYSGLALSKMLNPTSLNKFVNSYCISNKHQ